MSCMFKGAKNDMLKHFMNYTGDKKIIVFGTGKSGEKLTSILGAENIYYYIDNNNEKQGSYYMGKPVFSPDKLLEDNKDEIFVLIASMYHQEMSEQLRNMGLIEKKNFDFDFMVNLIGNTFVCPCCGGSYNEFLPFGIIQRPNAQCPSCGSLERHRLLWLHMMSKLEIQNAGLKVLHVAPEGIIQKNLKKMKSVEYISIDIDSPLADMKMDLTDLSFKDNCFDIILCNHVLEHIIDDSKAMSEMFRVLRPGGWASMMVPLCKTLEHTYEDDSITGFEERLDKFGQGDHVRIYGMDYFDRLRKAGFRVEVIEVESVYDSKSIEMYSLNKADDLIICSK